MTRRNHEEHDKITVGCLDCMDVDPDAYYRAAVADALRIVKSAEKSKSRWGTLHLHSEHMPGCYRCELRKDEQW